MLSPKFIRMGIEMKKYNTEQLKHIIKKHVHLIKYVKNQTEDMQLLAVEVEPMLLGDLKKPSDKVIEKAIIKNPYAIMYVKNQTEEMCKLAISIDPYVIKAIKYQTEDMHIQVLEHPKFYSVIPKHMVGMSRELQLIAIKKDPYSIGFVEDAHLEELQMEALKLNLNTIFSIKNPTLNAQMFVLDKNLMLFNQIANPKEEVINKMFDMLNEEIEGHQLQLF